MRVSISQYAVRVTCGLGLLLLPAVQQKLCTWPAPPDADTQQPADGSPLPIGDEEPKGKTDEPLTLSALLPDTLPPRWPNHAHVTATQRLRPLAVSTWMNGPVTSDDESSDLAGIDLIFAGGWSRAPAPQRLPTFGTAGLRLLRAHRHLFLTSILKTGPPCA